MTKNTNWTDSASANGIFGLASRIGSKGLYVQLSVFAGLCMGAAALVATFAGQGTTSEEADYTAAVEQNIETLELSSGWLSQSWKTELDTGTSVPSPAKEESKSWAATALKWTKVPVQSARSIDLSSRQVRLRRGDTLAGLLKREGVPASHAHKAITALSENFNLRRLKVGQSITLEFSADDPKILQRVAFKADAERTIRADLNDSSTFLGAVDTIELTRQTVRTGGEIQDSLYLAARQLAIPHGTVIDLIHIFSFDVDFQREIRAGDQFEVYFERYADEDGRVVKEGNILYARMTLRGKDYELYRFTPADSKRSDYFGPNGHSVRKALLRTPIDGARLTSRFGKRRHPILGYSRMHKGIDFGAMRGTPIRAAGDGIVERASRYGGYGKFIRIRHNGTYKTAYAHLNGYARGIKKGARVKQSQIIGYVGSTGRSTGPHLHYEVLKGGAHVNPLSLRLPSGRRLDGAQLTAFKESVNLLKAEIQSTPLQTLLAQNY